MMRRVSFLVVALAFVVTEEAAIEEGLKQKAAEFNEAGAEIYSKA